METELLTMLLLAQVRQDREVLANRLSADGKHKVLVLEAGRKSHYWSSIPVGFAKLIDNPAANWLYESEPDDGADNRRYRPAASCLADRARLTAWFLCAAKNRDYDTWAQLGNRGWSYEDVLPIFRDMENYNGDGDAEYRGTGGPLLTEAIMSRKAPSMTGSLRPQANSESTTTPTITGPSKTALA